MKEIELHPSWIQTVLVCKLCKVFSYNILQSGTFRLRIICLEVIRSAIFIIQACCLLSASSSLVSSITSPILMSSESDTPNTKLDPALQTCIVVSCHRWMTSLDSIFQDPPYSFVYSRVDDYPNEMYLLSSRWPYLSQN